MVNCIWFCFIDFEMDETKQRGSRGTRSKRGKYMWTRFAVDEHLECSEPYVFKTNTSL